MGQPLCSSACNGRVHALDCDLAGQPIRPGDGTLGEQADDLPEIVEAYSLAQIDGDMATMQAIYESATPAERRMLDQIDHGYACAQSSDPTTPRA